jgi:aspartate aminotransferase
VVLQVCGNNPTGCDPTSEEWLRIASVFKSKQHFAFLDLSYPGFVSGNVEQDCEPVRLFVSLEIPLLLATTYGKAFGLYGERVGHLSIPLPNNEVAMRVEQQMKLLARAETGAQPRFGAQLVANILQDLDLKRVWEQDLRHIAQDLIERRQRLENELCLQDNTMDWSFVTKQAGMFLQV